MPPNDPPRRHPGIPHLKEIIGPRRPGTSSADEPTRPEVPRPKPAVPPPLPAVHAQQRRPTLTGQPAPPPVLQTTKGLGPPLSPDLGTLEPPSEPPRSITPRSLVPAYYDSERERPTLQRAVERGGDRLVQPPPSTPLPTPVPRLRWFDTAEGVVQVVTGACKAIGALIGATVAALATYRATAPQPPPPPPPPEVSCPHWTDDKAKRGPLCQRLYELELSLSSLSTSVGTSKTAIGDLQRETEAIGKRVPAVTAK
jgi:hypothetical protein